jgi:hypothetical protein
LLSDIFQLIHPDHQPPERQELAHRVTRELTTLKPFVFPAPKREPEEPIKSEPRDDSFKSPRETLKKTSQSFPCEDCADHTYSYSCVACKAEQDRRWKVERERRRADQREQYKQRKLRRQRYAPKPTCVICGAEVEKKRADAECCSPACRQKLYRERKAGLRDKQPSPKQLARRQERERKARIKVKWDRLHGLDRGDTVIVNNDGHPKFPHGTKAKLMWAVRYWHRNLTLEDSRGYGRSFSREDVDKFDIVPEAAKMAEVVA